MREYKNVRRFKEHFKKRGHGITLAEDHPAVIEARTLFPSRVTDPSERLLKSGIHSRKIGNRVVKGKWYGMPIFTLTLEERATCPRSCLHWFDCYGNSMHYPPRHRHGEALEKQLEKELTALNQRYPGGFVVRLHVLGDFYSVHYVAEWGRWMQRFSALHVFGYTARWVDDDIGIMLMQVRMAFPSRWWIRWSGHDEEAALSTGESGITCPVQTGKTASCGTCGLCWSILKPIHFLAH